MQPQFDAVTSDPQSARRRGRVNVRDRADDGIIAVLMRGVCVGVELDQGAHDGTRLPSQW